MLSLPIKDQLSMAIPDSLGAKIRFRTTPIGAGTACLLPEGATVTKNFQEFHFFKFPVSPVTGETGRVEEGVCERNRIESY